VRAIVVDDSRAMRMILKRTATHLGFECTEAVDGNDALARIKEAGKPDLAMVDWNMPGMNGYEFVCAIRKDHAFDDMKIVMVTTETEMEQVVKALEAGANEYIMKPFTDEVIREKLELLGFQLAVV
jgi:two-component system, chemotaxis family, chemotaxis protein CheY